MICEVMVMFKAKPHERGKKGVALMPLDDVCRFFLEIRTP
jgi:hypothetical protein